MNSLLRPPMALGLALLMVGCAARLPQQPEQPAAVSGNHKAVVAADEDDWENVAKVEVRDPMEGLNRRTFWFNDQLYRYVAKPFSRTYRFLVPELARRGIHNAYENVKFPVRFVNHALQGRPDRAAEETGRFLLNSIVGIGGLMTPSDKIPALADLPKPDTGQTFAKWGIGHGPYLVLPLLGPSTCRDAVGALGDTALNPLSWAWVIFPGAAWTMAITAPDTGQSIPDRMDVYDTATKGALDPYISTRTGYIQYRSKPVDVR